MQEQNKTAVAGEGNAPRDYRTKERNQWTPADVANAIAAGFFTKPRFSFAENAPLPLCSRFSVVRISHSERAVTVVRRLRKNEAPIIRGSQPDEASRIERVIVAAQILHERHADEMLTAAEWSELSDALEGLN